MLGVLCKDCENCKNFTGAESGNGLKLNLGPNVLKLCTKTWNLTSFNLNFRMYVNVGFYGYIFFFDLPFLSLLIQQKEVSQ
jgi:hypothetical protein